MYKTSRTETPHDPTIPARPGWEGMFVHWLADRDHGNTVHLTEGDPVRLEEGDLLFISKGEWHGFANDTDRAPVAVTVMGGVSHYSEAGYEILPGSRPQTIASPGEPAP